MPCVTKPSHHPSRVTPSPFLQGDGTPLLVLAALLSRPEAVTRLCGGLCSPDTVRDGFSRTALHYACALPESPAVRSALIKAGGSEHTLDVVSGGVRRRLFWFFYGVERTCVFPEISLPVGLFLSPFSRQCFGVGLLLNPFNLRN